MTTDTPKTGATCAHRVGSFGELFKMPEPAFRLTWRSGRYTVSKPNIDSQDCYTEAQIKQAMRDALEQAARLFQGELGFCHDPMGQEALNKVEAEIRKMIGAIK